MGLVAEHEVERRPTCILRALDEADGVVRAEDDRHRVRPRVREHLADGRKVRRYWNLQFFKGSVLVVLSRTGIRADADVAVRHGPLLSPLAHRLLEQRYRGDEVEHSSAEAGERFGDTQGGEGLAGAARHYELSSVMVREAVEDIVDGSFLGVGGGNRIPCATTAPPDHQ